MSVTVEQMRPRLHTMSQLRDILATSEPLHHEDFTVGKHTRFRIGLGWQHGIDTKDADDPVYAAILLGGGRHLREHRLSKDALLQATSAIGLSKTYAARCPAPLLEPQLNYWFREGLHERKGTRDWRLLIHDDLAVGITKPSIVPFSNLRLVDIAEQAIKARYGDDEILADYKLSHTLRRTTLRLVVPAASRTMHGTGTAADEWSLGLQLGNSLLGDAPTGLDGYLFRWVCTNGQIDARASAGQWRRRAGNDDEVYQWATAAIDTVLGGLEPAFDAVQRLADIPIKGSVSDVLRDVFTHYTVPLADRTRIIAAVEAIDSDLTMYNLMAAITQAANETGIEPSRVDNLLRLGGDLPHAETSRCGACRRLMTG